MSSNAFARSRPRVRHQRVPRTHSCDHPRFLQLVNELARINEAKRKQEEIDGGGACSGLSSNDCGNNSTTCNNVTICSNSSANVNPQNGSGSSVGIVSNCCAGAITNINSAVANLPHSSNGYRSLDSNQSTSAPNDNHHHHHHRQQQHYGSHQQHTHHHHTHHHARHHQVNQDLASQQHLSNNNLQHYQHHQDDRCLAKGPSSTTSFGYSKQNLVVEQNVNSDFTNNASNTDTNDDTDLRQDENRSKRKRSATDVLSINSRKNSSSCSGSVAGSKRHKSSPDAIRPLSPSFTKCPICLLDSMDRDPSFTNTCFHLFCYVCIENWTKNKATCPLCRTKFTKIIYNIKSATNYEEKIASPIRRGDDEGSYITDRLMMEHLSSLNSNSAVSSRNSSSDEVQFLFENLRNHELIPPYFVNQIDPRQGESLHSFNTVTTSANFNSSVPHPSFASTNYPIGQNYLLFQQRVTSATSAAIPSAYTTNTNLTNMNNDPNSRRISRSSRFGYPRSYEVPVVDNPSSSNSARLSRASSANISNQQNIHLERHHTHQQPPSQQQQSHQQQHHQSYHPLQHHIQSTLDMNARQIQRMEQTHNQMQLPIQSYPIQHRTHFEPSAHFQRRNALPNHHQDIIDTLYRLPDL